jgi:hypothetical protein
MQFLKRYREAGEWLHHYEPATECQSMEWKQASSLRTKKFRSVLSGCKVTLRLFWDFNGTILEHYQDSGQMVNSARYCAMLEEGMKHVIRSKHK